MVGAKKQSNLITYIILIAGLLLIILPLYITLVTAFKSNEQSSVSYFTLPNPVYLDSFKEILSSERYYMALGNTVYVTAFVLIGNLTRLPQCGEVFPILEKMFNVHFLIPKYAEYRTAVGAALAFTLGYPVQEVAPEN